ncbi:hypothetical protein V8G54_005125 [Vigna mungo]|uniref:Transmembrane protein n=1 Tax=Vigna mungo TaxID=3915 RepID=A0AAQ3SGA2_VIGMU
MKRLLTRCMKAYCSFVSGLCKLQVGVAIAIFLFIFGLEFLVCKLGISIWFLLNGGEARRMGFMVARVWLELRDLGLIFGFSVCVDGGYDDMVAWGFGGGAFRSTAVAATRVHGGGTRVSSLREIRVFGHVNWVIVAPS